MNWVEKRDMSQNAKMMSHWNSIATSLIFFLISKCFLNDHSPFLNGRLLQLIQMMWVSSTELNFQLPPYVPTGLWSGLWEGRSKTLILVSLKGFRPTWLCASIHCPDQELQPPHPHPPPQHSHSVKLWEPCFQIWRPLPSLAKQKHIHVSKHQMEMAH